MCTSSGGGFTEGRDGMKMRSSGPAVLVALLVVVAPRALSQARTVEPVLAFPEAGVDDPAAYQGYQTRFYRDARGNVVQVYLDARNGRVVNVLADALNESVGFTARDGSGKPVRLVWASSGASVSASGNRRSIEYQLRASTPRVEIGLLILNSMRVERDLGYSGRYQAAFEVPAFRLPEQEQLIANIERLQPLEQSVHLRMLNARDASVLRSRLQPTMSALSGGAGRSVRGVRASQGSLDGKTGLQLEITVDPRQANVLVSPASASLRSLTGGNVTFAVRVVTDAPTLTPLTRGEIFNAAFLRFLADTRAQVAVKTAAAGRLSSRDAAFVSRYRQLERDVRGTELLSSREKLMAGLPNYGTYFGRDMMMTSLMMEPVWQDAMSEHVIASVLRKLGPNGDVSHEEALGGQAIRENAAEYNAHMAEYFRLAQASDRAAADTALRNARSLLVDLQRVRENYHMRDDEFQLPVLAARYLRNPAVPDARKRAFLLDSSDGRGPRVALLLRELGLVATLAAPYAREPVVQNLLGSPRLEGSQWRSVSWRDSNAGYANGRFAMDINAIWVPKALESTAEILSSLQRLGFAAADLGARSPGAGQSVLSELARDPASLQRAIQNWNGAIKHFIVSLPADEVRAKLERKLRSLPVPERLYWQRVSASSGTDRRPIEFVALSLDESGTPLQVVNTDPATWLFLHENRDSITATTRERVLRDARTFIRHYPVGLFVDRLGALVANDAFASPAVWEAFRKDTYHSPRVVWGREVNLIQLGLTKQMVAAATPAGQPREPSLGPYIEELRDALARIQNAVDASGLKHNELWSYEIRGGALHPIRYGASTDVQLWNVTDLAVQFSLSQIPLGISWH